MKVKCNYCDQMIEDNLNYCPFCGGSMPTVNRTATGEPRTIEELQQWYRSRNLPPENVTRFFIGKDIKEPKAFGIFKNGNGEFVVYKNKANGERAIRYQGYDEGYAVNELYQRLKTEIADQKSHSADVRATQMVRSTYGGGRRNSSGLIKYLLFFIFGKVGISMLVIVIAFLVSVFDHSPSRGYYRYRGNDYYYQRGSWYEYDDVYDTWDYLDDSGFLDDIIYDDTASDYRVYDHDGLDFEDTSWYYDSDSSYSSGSDSSYDYDWDSGSSWDSSDSWDSDYSSWDSDW